MNEADAKELAKDYWSKKKELEALKKKVADEQAPFEKAILELKMSIATIQGSHASEIESLEGTIASGRDLLSAFIPEGENSTFIPETHSADPKEPMMHTRVFKKTTYRTVIVDKARCVLFLVKNEKIEEGIKDLYLGYMKKIRDMALVDDAAVKLEPTVSIYVEEVDREGI
jgi:hypothetical protein